MDTNGTDPGDSGVLNTASHFVIRQVPHCPRCGQALPNCPDCGQPIPAPWVPNPWPGYPYPYTGDPPYPYYWTWCGTDTTRRWCADV